MKVSVEEARNVVWGDTSEWRTIKTEVVDTTRWSTIHEGIFEHIQSGKFYDVSWSVGSTEMQDERPFEYNTKDIDFIEVEEKEVWVPVKK